MKHIWNLRAIKNDPRYANGSSNNAKLRVAPIRIDIGDTNVTLI